MKNSKPEMFLDMEELSALENDSLIGGNAAEDIEVKKEKKKEQN